MALVLNSYAKLNLYLKVLNKRRDNYHEIKTIFERIDLCDKIILTCRRDNAVKIIAAQAGLPRNPSSNLAYKSAKLLQDSLGLRKGVNIKIIKRIPVGSGMGGGSSNAATVLLGLNKLWNLGLKQRQLAALAGKLGSDVAFFIYDVPFALGESRGEKISVIKSLKKVRYWHLIVVPRLNVSTEFVYKKWDNSRNSGLTPLERSAKLNKTFLTGLTKPRYDVKILVSGLQKGDFSLISRGMFNGLEKISSGLYPQIRQVREELSDLGLEPVLMSGSGPTLFTVLSSKKEALSLYRQLGKKDGLWQVFVASTI